MFPLQMASSCHFCRSSHHAGWWVACRRSGWLMVAPFMSLYPLFTAVWLKRLWTKHLGDGWYGAASGNAVMWSTWRAAVILYNSSGFLMESLIALWTLYTARPLKDSPNSSWTDRIFFLFICYAIECHSITQWNLPFIYTCWYNVVHKRTVTPTRVHFKNKRSLMKINHRPQLQLFLEDVGFLE